MVGVVSDLVYGRWTRISDIDSVLLIMELDGFCVSQGGNIETLGQPEVYSTQPKLGCIHPFVGLFTV